MLITLIKKIANANSTNKKITNANNANKEIINANNANEKILMVIVLIITIQVLLKRAQ